MAEDNLKKIQIRAPQMFSAPSPTISQTATDSIFREKIIKLLKRLYSS